MPEPATVGDLDPDREVYVKPSGNSSGNHAHLHNDPAACRYSGDLRAVTARMLFADLAVCKICAGVDIDHTPEHPHGPALAEVDDRPPWAPSPEVACDD